MDTSDSEAFQSADEDFDDEVTVKFVSSKCAHGEVKSERVGAVGSGQAGRSCGSDRPAHAPEADPAAGDSTSGRPDDFEPKEEDRPADRTGDIGSSDDADRGRRDSADATESVESVVDPNPGVHEGFVDPHAVTVCWEYESWEEYNRFEQEKKARESGRSRTDGDPAVAGTERKSDADSGSPDERGRAEVRPDREGADAPENVEQNDWDNDFDDWGDDDDDDDDETEKLIESSREGDTKGTETDTGPVRSRDVDVESNRGRGHGTPPRRAVRRETEKHDTNVHAAGEADGAKETRADTEKRGRADRDDPDGDFDDRDPFDGVEKPAASEEIAGDGVTPSLAKPSETSSDRWGNWSGWGVSSLLSTATGGVQTFTSQVSHGLSAVLESGIGIVGPEELARMQKLERDGRRAEATDGRAERASEDDGRRSEPGVFGLGNLMTGVGHITKLVESTGSRVVSTGLDTLEVIGKKTMEVLQDGDPGLAKKRALFGLDGDRPVLSRLLREAKERAEADATPSETVSTADARRVRYETLFDDHRGLVHLEALEMLSKQCEIKLESMVETTVGAALDDLRETLVQVEELCELPEEDDDEDETKSDVDSLVPRLDEAVGELGISLSYETFAGCWRDAIAEVDRSSDVDAVHERAIETLAKLTSIAVERFHRAAELLLIKERRSTADEADALVRLTVTVSTLIGTIAARFSEKLDGLSDETDGPALNSLITNVFFEATNSSSYVRDAFQLLIPILQAGAV